MNDGILGFLLSPWGWLTIGAMAAVIEMLVPGVYMIWLAAAAIATAGTVAILNLTVDGQLGAFALWIVAALVASQRWKQKRIIPSRDPMLNRRGLRIAGERAVVTEAIRNGRGRVRVGDTEWLADGPDAAVGDRLRVDGADGAVLRVSAEAHD